MGMPRPELAVVRCGCATGTAIRLSLECASTIQDRGKHFLGSQDFALWACYWIILNRSPQPLTAAKIQLPRGSRSKAAEHFMFGSLRMNRLSPRSCFSFPTQCVDI